MIGPSPRVRGKRLSRSLRCAARPGHPRACGENFSFPADFAVEARAIPARAGKTLEKHWGFRWLKGPKSFQTDS